MVFFALLALFWAGAVTCMLQAVNRVARSQELVARASALEALGSDVSDEDRRALVESFRDSMRKRL
jgi:uncharacterized membrane protein